MTESTRKKSSLGKKLLIAFGSLVVLLVVLFFVVTSGAFIKGFILPRVSNSVGADITAGDVSLSPFSSITLKKLKVQAPNVEPLLEAEEVVARYSLMDIIGGNINVSEVTINSPVIKLVEDENGNTNLDPLTKSKGEGKEPATKGEKPPALDIKNVSLKNATILKIKKIKGGGEERLELSNVNLSLDQLKNGGSSKLDLAAAVEMKASTNALAAALSGKFDFSLTQDLLPQNVKGSLQTDVKNASGTYADLKNLGLNLNADLSPTEIKNVALQFSQSGKGLGEVRVSGPFDANKVEGKLKLEVASIDKQVLNLIGAAKGIDFGSTKINSSNNIELSKGGKEIAMDGGVSIGSLSITRTNQTTPALDLNVKYSFTFDQAASNAVIKVFTIDGQQNQRELLRGVLSKPMKLDFAKADAGVDESAFELTVNDLNLADWKAFAADLNPAGKLGLKMNVVSRGAGKKINFDVAANLSGFGAKLGSNKVEKIDLRLSTVGQVADLAKVNLEKAAVDVSHNGQPAANVSASGQYAIDSGNADLKTTLEATLPTIFKFLASPDISASSGSLKFIGQVRQQGQAQTVTGNSSLVNFTGRYGEYRFTDFNNTIELNVEKLSDVVQLKKVIASFRQAENAGGSIEVVGNLDTKNQKGQFDLKLNKLNQHLLRPVLQASLGEKQLVSILIDGSASATLNSSNNMAFKADVALTNFVVKDAKAKQADAPLSVRLLADAAQNNQTFDLRQVKVGLSPTSRAKNELELKGQVDLSQSNAMKGKLTIQAEAIDITPFYDLYSAQPGATNGTKAEAPTSPETSTNEEPEPMQLPFKDFALDVNIGKFFLREVAITNFQIIGKVADNRIQLNPLQFVINGAPVKAGVDVNVGVKGYVYDLSLTGDKIPLEPIANSFVPKLKGQCKGDALANIQLKGAGLTGTGLRKNGNGQIGMTYTNAQIRLAPDGWIGGTVKLVGFFLNVDLLQSPLNWVDCQMTIGNGNIELKKADIASEMFQASAKGIVPIADVLANSPVKNIPVDLALRRSYAEKLKIVPANTPTNVTFVPLPNLVKLNGTLKSIEPEFNKAGLARLIAAAAVGGSVGELLKGTNSLSVGGLLKNTNNILGGLGGLLPGQKSGTNAATATNAVTKTNAVTRTNQPATNAVPGIINDINRFQNLFKKDK